MLIRIMIALTALAGSQVALAGDWDNGAVEQNKHYEHHDRYDRYERRNRYDRDNRYERRGRYGVHAVAEAAYRMEETAEFFHRQLRHERHLPHLRKDARRLARAARKFHREVAHHGRDQRLRRDYENLARSFENMRHELRRSGALRHDRRLRRDFSEVRHAFRNLDQTIQNVSYRYSSNHRHDDRGHDGARLAGYALGLWALAEILSD